MVQRHHLFQREIIPIPLASGRVRWTGLFAGEVIPATITTAVEPSVSVRASMCLADFSCGNGGWKTLPTRDALLRFRLGHDRLDGFRGGILNHDRVACQAGFQSREVKGC